MQNAECKIKNSECRMQNAKLNRWSAEIREMGAMGQMRPIGALKSRITH